VDFINHVGNVDVTEYQLDMADQLIHSNLMHNGYESVSIEKINNYDRYGRLETIDHNIAGQGYERIVKNKYNGRDELVQKILGQGIQKLDYTYHVRGWLQIINQPFQPVRNRALTCDTITFDSFPAPPDPPIDTQYVTLCDLLVSGEYVDIVIDDNQLCIDLPCPPPMCNPGEVTQQLDYVRSVLETMREDFTVVACEDTVQGIAIERVEVDSLVFPVSLQRVMLCDLSEWYLLRSDVQNIPYGFTLLQQIIIESAQEEVSVIFEGVELLLTIEELIPLIMNQQGQDLEIDEYAACEEVLCYDAPACNGEDILEQQMQISQIQDSLNALDCSQITYPVTLHLVLLCDGTAMYIPTDLLTWLTNYTEIDVITVTDEDDLIPINNQPFTELDTRDLFYLKLSYEDVPSVFEEAPPQRNGNISSMIWQVAGWNQQSYQFQYDPINRMKKAVYGDILPYTIFDPEAGGSTLVLLDDNRYGVDVPEYDPDGNIKWLWRRGMSEFCSDDSTEVKIALIDSLEYFFDPEGRLDSIYDHTLHAKGYYPGITGIEGSFGYDDNGNLINDPYKKLQYTYNIFNLPNGVFTTKGDMGMQYDAESIKLRKTLPNGKVRDYFGEIEYEDQAISIIHHAEGLIRKTGGEYRYDYVINDHLGNARVTFSDFNEDGKIQYLTEIMQENHYYPFGLNMEGLWTYGYGSSLANRFQYNGKERGDEIVLDDPVRDFDVEFGMYDYGARLYDPAIGRWTSTDPAAKMYSSWNPYHYVYNNPLKFIDPTGAIIEDPDDIVKNQKSSLQSNISNLQEFIDKGMVSSELGNKLIRVNKSMLKSIKNLEKSDQVYKIFNSGDGKEGGVQYDASNGNINIGIGSGADNYSGLVAHELEHASQYERGEISVVSDNSDYGVLYDITDETNAFNKERRIGMGIGYFTSPNAVFSDSNVRELGKTMTPPAYQSLPSGPININSRQGIALRRRAVEAGRKGQGVSEVYKGWQKDYANGVKKR
jgi:RHS repeat-associated protein